MRCRRSATSALVLVNSRRPSMHHRWSSTRPAIRREGGITPTPRPTARDVREVTADHRHRPQCCSWSIRPARCWYCRRPRLCRCSPTRFRWHPGDDRPGLRRLGFVLFAFTCSMACAHRWPASSAASTPPATATKLLERRSELRAGGLEPGQPVRERLHREEDRPLSCARRGGVHVPLHAEIPVARCRLDEANSGGGIDEADITPQREFRRRRKS